jgi:hypothetical protein
MRLDSRTLAIGAGLLGAVVVVSEVPYWRSASSLAPVLTALGVGLILVAVAIARPSK